MIRITKGPCPKHLKTRGKKLTIALKQKFTKNSANYLNGDSTFEFTSSYSTKTIVSALIACHHNKCCFSESKFYYYYPHVEHFRPKGKVDEWPTGTTSYPGYYWLAYDWSNLLLCAPVINSSFKRNFFPLAPGLIRNRSHHDKNIETPLLIDPSLEDPRNHIIFKGDEPIGITNRGKATINILCLKHPHFEEARREKLNLIKLLKEAVDQLIAKGTALDDPSIADMLHSLRSAILPDAEFSSMSIDFLSGWPHL